MSVGFLYTSVFSVFPHLVITVPRKGILKQFKAWVKGFYEEKWFIRDNFNKFNGNELKFGR